MGEMSTVGDHPAYRAWPVGEGPWPGLLLVHELFGLDDEMVRHADTLAAMGYLVVAPDLLDRGRRVVCLAQTMTALRAGAGVGAGRVGPDRGVPRPAPHQVMAPCSRHASSRPVGSSTVPPRFHRAR